MIMSSSRNLISQPFNFTEHLLHSIEDIKIEVRKENWNKKPGS